MQPVLFCVLWLQQLFCMGSAPRVCSCVRVCVCVQNDLRGFVVCALYGPAPHLRSALPLPSPSPTAPEGPETTAPPSTDTRTPQQRACDNLTQAVHCVCRDFASRNYLLWTDFKDAMARAGVRLSGVDWHDLRPVLTVSLHSTLDGERTKPLNTYVDLRAAQAYVGECVRACRCR